MGRVLFLAGTLSDYFFPIILHRVFQIAISADFCEDIAITAFLMSKLWLFVRTSSGDKSYLRIIQILSPSASSPA